MVLFRASYSPFKAEEPRSCQLRNRFLNKYANTMPQVGSINNKNIGTYVVGKVTKVFATFSYFCTV